MNWEEFVLAHLGELPRYLMAAVVGRTVEDVARLSAKGTGAVGARSHQQFARLFAAYHGRDPEDGDWPAPAGQGCHYDWLAPELTLVASLVGQISFAEIGEVLTHRLRAITGDPSAERTIHAVRCAIHRIGLQATDVAGGITTNAAANEIGSLAIVQAAIAAGTLEAGRVGRLWVIPYAAWDAWKAQRNLAPEGYVPLRSLRGPMGIKGDKLSEYATLGYVPTAVLAKNPDCGPSTGRGLWFVAPHVAEQLVTDRRAGRPMPWHGKPYPDNVRQTFAKWTARQHPAACQHCAALWGEQGAPSTFDDFFVRYPPLDHGAKRHLTRVWNPGITIQELSEETGHPRAHIARAIANGVLRAQAQGRTRFVTRSDATRWKARHCPTGDSAKSWLALTTAERLYSFTQPELQAHIGAGRLLTRIVPAGPARGELQVARQQCAELRETIGYNIEEAARRAKVDVARMRELLDGLEWREAERIPRATVDAAVKRLQSHQGHTLDEAARRCGRSLTWVKSRVDDGTVRVLQTRWSDRIYLSEPMLRRLIEVSEIPVKARALSDRWIGVGQSALLAGVSHATVQRWADEGALQIVDTPRGRRFHETSVRRRTRRYWKDTHFKRAQPPAWLQAEQGARAFPSR